MNGIKEHICYGHVDGQGGLHLYNQDAFWEAVQKMFPRSSIELIIRERSWGFSDAGRAYYFGVVVKEIQKAYLATGVVKTLHDVDYELRELFLFKEIYNPETDTWEKQIHTLRKHETEVTRKMLWEYLDKCIIWAVQTLEWPIPYPGEELKAEEDPNRKPDSNPISF